MLAFLDIFFIVLHSAIIIFNLFGWIWKSTRKANLALLSATAFSWLVLGIWYGWGYCPFTDWHWQVLRAMGKSDIPNSYIKYLADRLAGLDVDAVLVDYVTAGVFAVVFIVSIVINMRDYRKREKVNFDR